MVPMIPPYPMPTAKMPRTRGSTLWSPLPAISEIRPRAARMKMICTVRTRPILSETVPKQIRPAREAKA